MAEDYWGPVFARLLEDTDLLGHLCRDTADADLLNWVLPNRPLAHKCARYIRRHKITNRAALIDEVMDAASEDQELRKIILFTWIEKNPKTMGFLSVPANPENIARLVAGSYGKPGKIKLLARIDPRKGAGRIYEKYFAEHPELELEEKAATAATLAMPDLEKRLHETTEMATKAVKRSRELEGANDKLKTDNRQLKKDLESRDKEVSTLNRNLEDNVLQLKTTASRLEELECQLSSLQLQLKNFADREPQPGHAGAAPADTDANAAMTIAALKDAGASFQQQIDGMQKALQNRDKSIERLETEKAELLARLRTDTDQQRRIENLQLALKNLEGQQNSQAQLDAGQLVTRVTNPGRQAEWLFISVTGRAVTLPAPLVKSSEVIIEEFALLACDSDGVPVKLVSLEADGRRALLGYLKEESDNLWFVSDEEEKLPVCVACDPHLKDKPLRGICLGETDRREAGIYYLEPLKTSEEKSFVSLSASARQLQAFFNADLFDFDAFCSELGKLKVSFKHEKDQQLKFSRDYRQVLTGLRPSLPVAVYCSAPACLERARLAVMARACKSGQSCSFCGGFPASEGAAAVFQFSGQRLHIFGGDRIGPEYERVLARHNLVVTWHSGFQNLHDLRNGFGKTDALVVIVRQISHTLLRELVPLAAQENLPLIYCTRRGSSGVLSHLLDHFLPNQKKPLR